MTAALKVFSEVVYCLRHSGSVGRCADLVGCAVKPRVVTEDGNQGVAIITRNGSTPFGGLSNNAKAALTADSVDMPTRPYGDTMILQPKHRSLAQ